MGGSRTCKCKQHTVFLFWFYYYAMFQNETIYLPLFTWIDRSRLIQSFFIIYFGEKKTYLLYDVSLIV